MVRRLPVPKFVRLNMLVRRILVRQVAPLLIP